MRRGEVWWVNFHGAEAEIQKARPAVVVSNNGANRTAPLLQVVPLTSNVSRQLPGDALVTVAGKRARALCNQIQSADRSRFSNREDVLSADDIRRVDRALKVQLALT